MEIGKTSLICNSLAVNGVTTVWTNTFKIGFSKNFSIEAVCATSTTPAIKVQLEVSYLQLKGVGANQIQGASSIYYVVPDAFPDVFSDIVDTNYHVRGIYPPFAIHARYKISGLVGNPADTTITIYNMLQELGRTYGA